MTSGRWSTSTRRAELPRDWYTHVRPRILERDPTCTMHLPGCTVTSTDVDHIGDKHWHDDTNLRGVCNPCHKKHTAHQATLGQAAARARKPRQRPTKPHPGTTQHTQGGG